MIDLPSRPSQILRPPTIQSPSFRTLHLREILVDALVANKSTIFIKKAMFETQQTTGLQCFPTLQYLGIHCISGGCGKTLDQSFCRVCHIQIIQLKGLPLGAQARCKPSFNLRKHDD